MKVELFPFQRRACDALRGEVADALGSYQKRHVPQVISFTAPTGAGKTIIMASLVEKIFCGDDNYMDQPEAIFVWLSDSPQLNEQSKLKLETKADKIKIGQCVTVEDDSFDQELLDDGHIYFLNTQKLGGSSNLVKHGDARTYTIWETLANTVREKSDRLYFIIDEAHRGMQGKEAGIATTIMQKFIKGSPADDIPPMPVVVGMSATTQRFNDLVKGIVSTTIRFYSVTPDEVRSSGLLKDRIIIKYPEGTAVGSEMTVLYAAADDWREKWVHWEQYCREQHYAYVNPIFVVQVQNGNDRVISETNLDDCLRIIEERSGVKFKAGEVVHTFGQTDSAIISNGLEMNYVEPSRVSDDMRIKVVFFKENLSTGWDCPRAETMMSFRRAVDATYIAQLLGRMVRTPMQMHVQVDDVLNDVHLYLPHFDENTVSKVVNELQNSEGGNIPTEVEGEKLDSPLYETWTTQVRGGKLEQPSAEYSGHGGGQVPREQPCEQTDFPMSGQSSGQTLWQSSEQPQCSEQPQQRPDVSEQPDSVLTQGQEASGGEVPVEKASPAVDSIDRDGILKYINELGLLSYKVRDVAISNYLASLYKLAHLLTQSGYCKGAKDEVHGEIAAMIHKYVEGLKAAGSYEGMSQEARRFELNTQIFDSFGRSLDEGSVRDLFTIADVDVERQFRIAENKLGNDGVGNTYGNIYGDMTDPAQFMLDVILFTSDTECMGGLEVYAREKFHTFNDGFRRKFAAEPSDRIRRQYDSIVSDGDVVSKHNFRIPEIVQERYNKDGKPYSDHLLVNPATGVARIGLNSWEEATLEEERRREDFVCWLRNPVRVAWSLCVPYEYMGKVKSAYPDLIIVRRDEDGYVIDILEPHQPTLDDNLGKARGLAEYARQNPGAGRIQLLRAGKDALGHSRMLRLDMSRSAVRDKVSKAQSPDELNHIFDTDGFFE